jgi:transposase
MKLQLTAPAQADRPPADKRKGRLDYLPNDERCVQNNRTRSCDVRIWVRKFEAGAFDDEAQSADLLQDYEAKIAALERMVGRQALEIEFLKGALKSVPRPRSASTSVITGPVASPSPKDAG